MKRSQNIITVKRIFIGFGMMFLFLFSSCEDLSKINVDPTKASPDKFNPNYFLSNSEWNYLNGTMGYSGSILFQSGWVQILASTSSGGANYYSNMDKYVTSSNTNAYSQSSWNTCYQSATLANRILAETEGKSGYDNLRAVAKIMVILNIQYITDLYGDCPYSEAFKALAGNVRPAYDSQQTLYTTLLNELEAATGSLDVSKDKPSADLIYDGDIAKWKKFGNSLLLRMAMRLIKIDPAKAKTYSEKAAAGGTFANSEDNAFIKCNFGSGYQNDYARDLLTPADFYQVRWSKKLMDYLQSTNDPRISAIAEIPKDGLAANQDIKNLTGDNTASKQLGMPNGYDLNGGDTDISKSPGYPGGTGSGDDLAPLGKYSRPRMSVYADRSGNVFIYSYAQTELLLAEAAVRGFKIPGSAAEHYRNALIGAMQAMATIGAEAAIASKTAADYANAHPLDLSSPDKSLKMINEQYWATGGCLFNFTEVWNNWRRTGYPALTPVVYTGNFSNGQIPRRQLYPTGEGTSNSENYNAAVTKLPGGDKWTSRVWWDK